MEHVRQQSITNWLAYDNLELAECGRRIPLASTLAAGGRKDAPSTTSSYWGGVETADLPVEDPSLEELRLASGLGRRCCLSDRWNERWDSDRGVSGAWLGVSSPVSSTPPVDVLKAGRKNITPRRRRDRRVDWEGPRSDDT